jgi:FkbM family methyltransferase
VGDEDFQTFVLEGVTLEVPIDVLSPKIVAALESGRYERLEARQIQRFLKKGDRLLEFGAGIGFISALASKTTKLDKCLVVEANPALIPVIRRNHEINNVTSTIVNAISVPPSAPILRRNKFEHKMEFFITENFWGSSTEKSGASVRSELVDIIDTSELISLSDANVIVCDIEGGECDIFDDVDLSQIRNAFFEVHKNITGLSRINKLTSIMASQGLYYDPDFSVGATVMYTRV